MSAGTGTDETVDVNFDPSNRHPNLPVEVVTIPELNERMSDLHARSLQRIHFHLLLVCSGGTGAHLVDFTPFPIEAGTVVHVRPGQAQQFDSLRGAEARLVIWPPEHQPTRTIWYPGSDVPTSMQASPDETRRIVRWVDELVVEQNAFDGSVESVTLMRTMLSVILQTLDRLHGATTDASSVPLPYRELRQALEPRVLERPSVSELAAEIGYSTRTLDRACKVAVGRTAKQVIDERINLELRRLLADLSQPMGSIRAAFGLSDPSNFAKFARRHLGQPPGDFRASFA